MDPAIWGSDTWKFLHVLSINEKASYKTLKTFFYNLRFMLPCKKCRDNYIKHYKELPFPNNKKNIKLWLIELHNNVNKEINKPIQNSKQILDFWRTEMVSYKYSTDTGIWTFILSSISVHPGKRYISEDIAKSHKFFWEHLDELLPKHLHDYNNIIDYLNKNKIPDTSYKTLYNKYVHKLFNIVNNKKIYN